MRILLPALLVAALSLSGCVSMKYSPPTARSAPPNEIVAKMPFEAAWERLIDHASKTSFAIENFEKASGLLILSFGASDPAPYVDCGYFDATAPAWKWAGPYASHIVANLRGTFTGKMNILVQRASDTETKVRVTARYILFAPADQYTSATTWSFDTGGASTQRVVNANMTGEQTRRCVPTGAAEREILKAFE